MKNMISLISASAMLLALPAQADNSLDSNPGYIDFSKYISVSAEDSTVEVNLKAPLLKLASSLIETQNEDFSKLIESVQLVRVHVLR